MKESHAAGHRDSFPGTSGEKVQPGEELEFETCGAGVAAVLDYTLVSDFGDDGTEFGLDAGVCAWEAAEFGEAGETVVLAVDECEPARGVGVEVNSDAEEGGGHHLEAEGEAEGGFAGDVAGGVGDPVGDDDAECDGDGFEDEENAAEFGG